MIENKFKNKIISLIPSLSLREVIKSENYQLSDNDLLKIITNHAKDYQQKIAYYKYIMENSDNKNTVVWAKKLIKYQKKLLEEFTKESQDCIYEILIKTEPNSYEEKYFSFKYDDAITIIKTYLKYYKDCNAAFVNIVVANNYFFYEE